MDGRNAGNDWWRHAVVYQIYPRSFADANGDGVGDLNGITAHLDPVASLGVDAVWISPFYTSPMKDFGYDVADYCDVDPVFGTLADFDRLVAPGFWETGATGRRYSRVFARQVLAQRPGRPDPGTWQTDQHHLQRVSEDVWLLTYRLRQPGRVTRRMTLWRREAGRWQAVYHQGTVVAG